MYIMKTLLLTFTCGMVSLFAQTAKYDVTFSLFGKIGESSVERTMDKNGYVIAVTAKTLGLAASATDNHYERYISQGTLKDGVLVPDVLTIERGDDNKVQYTVFRFDHENRIVEKDKCENKRVWENSFDVSAMKIVSTEKREFSYSTGENDYYAENDIVSLAFNGKHFLKDMKAGEIKHLSAIGVDTDNGEVVLRSPSLKQKAHMQQVMACERDNRLFTIGVDRELFEDENGVLFVNMDPDGFPREAMMENLVMFGDVRGSRVYEHVAVK
jgi:hypothetical protein